MEPIDDELEIKELDQEFLQGLDMNSPPMNPQIEIVGPNFDFSDEEQGFVWDQTKDKAINNFIISSRSEMDLTLFEKNNEDGCFHGKIQSYQSEQKDLLVKFQTTKSEQSLSYKKFQDQEKADKIKRYIMKKSQRVYNKIIRYQSRKRVAKDKVRAKGRFAKERGSSQLIQKFKEKLPIKEKSRGVEF